MFMGRTPGFSAEASLCRSSGNHQVISTTGGLRQVKEGMIQPALPPEVDIGCYHYHIVDRAFNPRSKLLRFSPGVAGKKWPRWGSCAAAQATALDNGRHWLA